MLLRGGSGSFLRERGVGRWILAWRAANWGDGPTGGGDRDDMVGPGLGGVVGLGCFFFRGGRKGDLLVKVQQRAGFPERSDDCGAVWGEERERGRREGEGEKSVNTIQSSLREQSRE